MFKDIYVTAVDVRAHVSLVTRNFPFAHDDKDGLSADDNHPSTFKELFEGSERDLRSSGRNANRCGSRERSPGVSGPVNTVRKRKSGGSKIHCIDEVDGVPPVIKTSDDAADVTAGNSRNSTDLTEQFVGVSPNRLRLKIVLVLQDYPGTFLFDVDGVQGDPPPSSISEVSGVPETSLRICGRASIRSSARL